VRHKEGLIDHRSQLLVIFPFIQKIPYDGDYAKLGFVNPGLFMKIRVLGFKEAKKVFLHGVLVRVKASECGPQWPT